MDEMYGVSNEDVGEQGLFLDCDEGDEGFDACLSAAWARR